MSSQEPTIWERGRERSEEAERESWEVKDEEGDMNIFMLLRLPFQWLAYKFIHQRNNGQGTENLNSTTP